MHITLNFAITADGKISTKDKTPATFTSQKDLDRLLEIRCAADAILVGRGTLEADSMSLTIPEKFSPKKQPLRCVASRAGGFDPNHAVFEKAGGDIHLLATEAGEDFREEKYPKATLHRMSLADFLQKLEADFGAKNLLCEGGGELAKALFVLDVVDTLHLTLATHTLFGGHEAPTLTGIPGEFLPASRHFTLKEFEPQGNGEIFLTYQSVKK